MNVFLFLVAIFVFSQLGNIIRFSEATATVTTFWRLLFSISILIPMLIYTKSHRDLLKVSKREFLLILLAGTSLFVAFDLFVEAVQTTTVAQATIIFSIHPIITAIGGLALLKEKVRLNHGLAFVFGTLAIYVLFNQEFSMVDSQTIGSLYAILAAFSFSVYMGTSKVARKTLSNSVFVSLVYMTAAFISLVTILFNGEVLFENSAQSWWSYLALAIFPTLLGHAVFTYLLKKENLNYISCGILAHSPLAAITANFLFGEPVSFEVILSITLSSVGLICVLLPYLKWQKKRKGNNETLSPIRSRSILEISPYLAKCSLYLDLQNYEEDSPFKEAA